MKPDVRRTHTGHTFLAGCVLVLLSITCAAEPVVIEMDLPDLGVIERPADYIVQAANVGAAAEAVTSVGGTVTEEVGSIQAVRAALLPPQVELLKRRSDVRRISKDTTS